MFQQWHYVDNLAVLTFEILPNWMQFLVVHLAVTAGHVVMGTAVEGAVLQVSRAGALLGGVGVAQLGIDFVKLQSLDCRCIVVHAVEARAGGTAVIAA